MKITLNDIDNLIDVIQELKVMASCCPAGPRIEKLTSNIERIRKVYMILLHCTSQNHLDFDNTKNDTLHKASVLLEAITNLCPHVV